MTDTWLGHMIRRNAKLDANGLAFVDADKSLTHGQYLERSLRLAQALRQDGVARTDRVAILSMNRIEYMEVCGACEVSGFIAATVNFRLSAHEVRQQLIDCAPIVLIFEDQYADLVNEIRPDLDMITRFICLDGAYDWAETYEHAMARGDAAKLDIASTIDDIGYLVYTSGSTGRPKGCMLGQRELARKAEQHASDLSITSDDKALIVMPLFHTGARGVASGAQWRGATVHLHRGFDPGDFIRTVASEGVTIAHLAPTMVQMVVEHPLAAETDMSGLNSLLYAAAAMPSEVLQRGLKLFGGIFHQSYGQTEGIVSALPRHQHKPNGTEREKRRLLSVGQPYPGVDVRLITDDGEDVTETGTGEIVYRGGAMFRGYWNNSVATLATVRDGWIYSGDIGRFDEDGFLYIVDRKKDMIISGGENIASREVEEALLSHPQVAEAAVVGLPHPKWGETVHAVVILRDSDGATSDQLIDHCRQFLASYKKPTGVTFMTTLPKMANGKIDKVALRNAIKDSHSST